MKTQLISKLVFQPWNINKLHGRSIIGQMLMALMRSARPEQDDCGSPLPVMRIENAVAIIPICGRLMLNVPDWAKSWGLNLTDINDIEVEIEQALNNSTVRFLCFDYDSPGGESVAGDKLFDLVEAATKIKPTLAFCGDGAQMDSSAYEGAAGALALYCGKYAEVGCIGSYLAFLDDTEYWKKQGINFNVLRSGALKGIGEDEITDKQIAYLQGLVDAAGDTFRRNVQKYRTGISREDMEGQWFNGSSAVERGFCAGTVKDLQSALAKFRSLV